MQPTQIFQSLQSPCIAYIMAVCPICTSQFANIRQLGAHVRSCRRSVTTTPPTAQISMQFSPPVITVPVTTVSQLAPTNTPMSELARRELGGKSWRQKDVHFVGLPAMPPAMLATDFSEVVPDRTHVRTYTHTNIQHTNIHTYLTHTSCTSCSHCGMNTSPMHSVAAIESSGRYLTRVEAKRVRVRTRYVS